LEKIALPLGRRAMKTGYRGGLMKKTAGQPATIPCFAELTEFCYSTPLFPLAGSLRVFLEQTRLFA
jgi:hypothetical protein